MLSSFKGRQHFFALLIGVSIKKLTVLFPWSSNKIYILKQFLTINKICKKKNTKKENIVVLSKFSFFIKHNAHGEGDFFKKSNRTLAFLVLLQLFLNTARLLRNASGFLQVPACAPTVVFAISGPLAATLLTARGTARAPLSPQRVPCKMTQSKPCCSDIKRTLKR